METKFCKDCKYLRPAIDIFPKDSLLALKFAKCAQGPKNTASDNYGLIAPEVAEPIEYEYCNVMRASTALGAGCGKDGKLWSPREEPEV